MPALVKFFVGLAAVLLMAWINHGPLGGGKQLVDRLEGKAQAVVAKSEVPGVQVRLGHDPFSRQAILSGPADQFQREGQGSLKGLNDVVGEIEGVSGVRWTNPPPGSAPAAAPNGRTMPLLLESMLSVIPPFLVGIALAWLVFGRRKRETYL